MLLMKFSFKYNSAVRASEYPFEFCYNSKPKAKPGSRGYRHVHSVKREDCRVK